MADISSITLPGGGTYDLKDKNAVSKYGMGKNLLRNWYFVGGGTGRGVFPVNQRGVTSGTSTNNTYSIDAWKWTYGRYPGSWSLVSGGISVSPSGGSDHVQLFQELGDIDSLSNGKVVTASILYSDGILATGSITRHSGTTQIFASVGSVWVLGIVSNSFRIRFGSSRTVSAVKLELGTQQTLCHNEGTTESPVWVLNDVPDYEYEFYRCIISTADSTDTYANKSLATEQQLAYVETGTTASRNYTTGYYICWNGLTYTADTNIATGTTLSASGGNKNLTECVGGGFNSLSNVTNDSVTFSNNVTGYTYPNRYHLSKSGNIVATNIYMSTGSIAGSGTLLYTVPAAFRPSVDRPIAAWLTYDNQSKVETVLLRTTGEIITSSGGSSVTGWIRVFGMYIL